MPLAFLDEQRIAPPAPAFAADAVTVREVSKAFRLPTANGGTEVNQALDRVSLSVGRGEFLGIVGRNGSGKSTLLRCIAGIYGTDAGTVAVTGRVAPFLELGIGVTPELTARENVLIGATMLGLSRREARARSASILDFAELTEHAEVPLKNYSSGMSMRLAFAIAINVDADVLLLDEVLAVGDASFQRRCFEEFERLRGRRTVVLVSHDMNAIERFCDRAVLLEAGRVVETGETGRVARRYVEMNERPRPEGDHRQVALAGRPSHSAVAVGDDPGRLFSLAWTLTTTSLRSRFAGSRLGFVWAVLQPLLLFGVLYAVFNEVVRLGPTVPHYAVSLLSAIVLWTFFASATSTAVGSLVARGAMIRKLRFPRAAVPLSVVLTALVDLGLNIVVLGIFLLASGLPVRASWLELVPVVFVLVALTTGVALLLAAMFLRWRDTGHLWAVVQRGLFYGSAVLYPASLYPDSVERLLTANPLAAVFTQTRHALLGPSAPSLAAALGGPVFVLVPLAIVLGVVLLGAWAFWRAVPRMAENL
jgi:ABC-type polysaccharide/polyol phosphate transport system ATPase subunit/ABC-type polysaccharide/polyol phosphate export permease